MVLYNISVVLHPSSSTLVGSDNLRHVTAKNKMSTVDVLRDSGNMNLFGVDDMSQLHPVKWPASSALLLIKILE